MERVSATTRYRGGGREPWNREETSRSTAEEPRSKARELRSTAGEQRSTENPGGKQKSPRGQQKSRGAHLLVLVWCYCRSSGRCSVAPGCWSYPLQFWSGAPGRWSGAPGCCSGAPGCWSRAPGCCLVLLVAGLVLAGRASGAWLLVRLLVWCFWLLVWCSWSLL